MSEIVSYGNRTECGGCGARYAAERDDCPNCLQRNPSWRTRRRAAAILWSLALIGLVVTATVLMR